MSLAFRLQPRRSLRVVCLVLVTHGCALLGACLAALHLASGGRLAASGLMLSLLIPLAWSWRRAWRQGPGGAVPEAGELLVDAAGASFWLPSPVSPPPSGRPAPEGVQLEPLQPLRWLCFAGIVWIEGRAAGRRWRLLSGADAMPDRTWRGLMRWLRWLDRGA